MQWDHYTFVLCYDVMVNKTEKVRRGYKINFTDDFKFFSIISVTHHLHNTKNKHFQINGVRWEFYISIICSSFKGKLWLRTWFWSRLRDKANFIKISFSSFTWSRALYYWERRNWILIPKKFTICKRAEDNHQFLQRFLVQRTMWILPEAM